MVDDAYTRKLANDEANRQAIIRELEQESRRVPEDSASREREAQRQRQMSENIKNNYKK